MSQRRDDADPRGFLQTHGPVPPLDSNILIERGTFLRGRTRMSHVIKYSGLFALLFLCVLPGCNSQEPKSMAPILLFGGTGSSPNDVAAVEAILKERRIDYAKVNSRQLNGMSESQLLAYRLMIIPGGNYIKMGDSLTSSTTMTIHNAVHSGLNYLGICAGGLLAGNAPGAGLNLTSGVRFGFYAAVNRGIHKAAVPITCAGSPTLEHYWEDGPEFTGWGEVVGKYPDETPAIVQASSGQGWVVLCGVHPEAPAKWRTGMNFTTPANEDIAYAALLIEAALQGKPLPHF